MLSRYEEDSDVYHISGCNFFEEITPNKHSYFFTSIVNVWGWATWSRAWNRYDLEMKTWERLDKKKFLSKWCVNSKIKNDTLKMFDLHCKNPNPWTWDYQWVYTCWANNGLSVMPTKNLVQNIGFGPNATHTKFVSIHNEFPKHSGKINFPLDYPPKIRNIAFEKKYFQKQSNSLYVKLKYLIIKMFKN